MGDADSETWGGYLRRMTTRPNWSVVRLARESGIHRSTIFGWITADTPSLTIASVRAIADALGEDLETALRAAGHVTTDAAPDSPDEAEVRRIMDSALSDDLKRRLVAHVRAKQERDRQVRAEEVRMLAQAAGEDPEDL